MGHRSTSNSKDHHHHRRHHSSSSSTSKSRSRSPHNQPKDEDARHAILNEIEKEKKLQEEEDRKKMEKIRQEYSKRRFSRNEKREERKYEDDSKPKETESEEKKDDKPKEVAKPDFGLSGALASDARTGNIYKGFVLKWSEPAEARKPTKYWRLYVFKGENKDPVQVLHIHKQSAYLLGHQKEICDIYLEHPSISKQHAVIQFRLWQGKASATGLEGKKMVKPYIMDLKSANGTFLNGERIEPERYIEIMEEDVLKFGGSSRDYVLLSDKTGKE